MIKEESRSNNSQDSNDDPSFQKVGISVLGDKNQYSSQKNDRNLNQTDTSNPKNMMKQNSDYSLHNEQIKVDLDNSQNIGLLNESKQSEIQNHEEQFISRIQTQNSRNRLSFNHKQDQIEVNILKNEAESQDKSINSPNYPQNEESSVATTNKKLFMLNRKSVFEEIGASRYKMQKYISNNAPKLRKQESGKYTKNNSKTHKITLLDSSINFKRFEQKLLYFFKQNTFSGRLQEINDKVRDKIQDNADFIQGRIEKVKYFLWMDRFWHLIASQFEKINIPLFNPEQKWRVGFNTFIVLFNCFYIYITTYKIAFAYGTNLAWILMMQQIAQVIWIADMIIQMNTAMYHDNEFTKDRKTIMKIFLKEYFFFEVLPIIFENLHSTKLSINIIFHIPLLLKIKGIMIMLSNLEFYILQILENHSIFLLFKLFMKMIIFGHILACFRYSVIQYEIYISHEPIIWSLNYKEFHEEEQLLNYLNCLYWAFSIMLNVAHPNPTTKLEVIFTTSCMLISCIGFGYLLTAIGIILRQLSKRSEDYKRDLSILNNFMKRKKIDIGLKRRANISLKKHYEQQVKTKIIQERATLDKVDSRMFKELMISSNQKAIKYCPILSNIFSQSTLDQICMNLEEIFLVPNQSILDHQSKNSEDHFLYIVLDGKIQVTEQYFGIQSNTNTEGQQSMQLKMFNKLIRLNIPSKDSQASQKNEVTIQAGQYFGLMGFILDQDLISKAQSLEYSTLLRISTSQVQQIIENNTKDKETYMEIKERLLHGSDVRQLNLKCDYCMSKSHLSQDCYLIHFNKRHPFTYAKFNFSPPQMRNNQIKRNCSKYLNALLCFQYINDNVQELRQNYGILTHQDNPEDSFLIQSGGPYKSNRILRNNTEDRDYPEDYSNHEKKQKGISIILDQENQQTDNLFCESQEQDSILQSNLKKSIMNHPKRNNQKFNNNFSLEQKEDENLLVLSQLSLSALKNNDYSPNNQIFGQQEILLTPQSMHKSRKNETSNFMKSQTKNFYRGKTNKTIHSETNKSVLSDRLEENSILDCVEEETKMNTIMPTIILSKGNQFYNFQDNENPTKQQNKELSSYYHSPLSESNILIQQSSLNQSQRQIKSKQLISNHSSCYVEKQINLSQSQTKKKSISYSNSSAVNFANSLQMRESRVLNTQKNENIQSFQKIKTKYLNKIQSLYNQIKYEKEHSNIIKSIIEDKMGSLVDSQNSHSKQSKQNNQIVKYEEQIFSYPSDKIQDYLYYFNSQNSHLLIKKYNSFNEKKLEKYKSKASTHTKKEKKSLQK